VGLLAIALRFFPYAGAWVAAALPALLAFAISDDWSLVAWTLGVFLALGVTLVYALVPWLYGRSTGLSAIAIMAATVLLDVAVGDRSGLLLATPLTVCVSSSGAVHPATRLSQPDARIGTSAAAGTRFYQRIAVARVPGSRAACPGRHRV
jgi:predicted PurR-regulated permease PerM